MWLFILCHHETTNCKSQKTFVFRLRSAFMTVKSTHFDESLLLASSEVNADLLKLSLTSEAAASGDILSLSVHTVAGCLSAVSHLFQLPHGERDVCKAADRPPSFLNYESFTFVKT